MLTNNLVVVCMVSGMKNQSAILVTFCALFMTRWILQKLPFRKNCPSADARYNKGYSRFGPTAHEHNWHGLAWAWGWHLRTLFSSLLVRRFQCHNIVVGEVVPSPRRPLRSGVWRTIIVPASKVPVRGVIEGEV